MLMHTIGLKRSASVGMARYDITRALLNVKHATWGVESTLWMSYHSGMVTCARHRLSSLWGVDPYAPLGPLGGAELIPGEVSSQTTS